MKKESSIFGKLLCLIGWHKFTCSLQDCIDEFGCIPNDGRMPSSSKCKRCGVSFKKQEDYEKNSK